MRSEVKHIFDRSACLSKRQVQAYLSGNMITEEVYALEHHVNGCPLCSIALDGYQMRKDSVGSINTLSSDFLKDHFGMVAPQLHLNSMTYARSGGAKKEVSFKGAILMLKLAVAAAACVGIMWYIQNKGGSSNNNNNEEPPAQQQALATTVPEPEENSVIVDAPIIIDSGQTTIAQPLAPASEPSPTGTPVTTSVPATNTTTTLSAVQNNEVNSGASILQPVEIPQPVILKEEKPEPVKQEVAETPKLEKPAPEKPKPAPVTKPKEPEDDDLPSDGIQAATVLVERGKYSAALTKLRPEMRSDNKSRRQEAVIVAAKVYQQMGNKARAIEMLNMIVDEGGPQKRTAKRMLKDMGASD